MGRIAPNINQGQEATGQRYSGLPSSPQPFLSQQTSLRSRQSLRAGLGSNVNNSNREIDKLLKSDRWNINRYIHQALITEGIVSKNRYASCMCKSVAGKEVEIHIHPRHRQVSTKNLITCKSVWVCPVCRSRLLAEKAEKIEKVV